MSHIDVLTIEEIVANKDIYHHFYSIAIVREDRESRKDRGSGG
jgi:hypothetical protein